MRMKTGKGDNEYEDWEGGGGAMRTKTGKGVGGQ